MLPAPRVARIIGPKHLVCMGSAVFIEKKKVFVLIAFRSHARNHGSRVCVCVCVRARALHLLCNIVICFARSMLRAVPRCIDVFVCARCC